MKTKTPDLYYRYIRLKHPYEVNQIDRKDLEKSFVYQVWCLQISWGHMTFHLCSKIMEIVEGVRK